MNNPFNPVNTETLQSLYPTVVVGAGEWTIAHAPVLAAVDFIIPR